MGLIPYLEFLIDFPPHTEQRDKTTLGYKITGILIKWTNGRLIGHWTPECSWKIEISVFHFGAEQQMDIFRGQDNTLTRSLD